MIESFKFLAKPIVTILRLLYSDFKTRFIHQYFPAKPLVINFNANDICNSKCAMCNIWKQKKDKEMTPGELAIVLQDALFKNVRHVGVTGGEPTLRTDLADLYGVICSTIPALVGVSIITNAIKEKEVIERIAQVNEVCKKHKKSFSVMVSLDGVDVTHDRIRGRKGNFASALKVIDFVKSQNLPVSIGCTVTKDNVWEVDKLLDFAKGCGIYARFRVGEFINRLYNNDLKDVIRNFTSEEAFHLACFYQKLILTYEKDESVQRTYGSIINILMGGKRKIGCPYQSLGVVLDTRGDMQYCAPKSKKIGNSLEKSGSRIYSGSLQERRRIIKNDCDDCIHDYHASITYREKLEIYWEAFWRRLLTIDNIRLVRFFSLRKILPIKKSTFTIFIVGWYGTETTGDKAILSGILEYYKSKYSNPEFVIASMYPFVTKQTLRELDINGKVIHSYGQAFVHYSRTASEVVMGGGPLMNMEALSIPLWAFSISRIFKSRTVVFGCGIGPISGERYPKVVKRILSLADEISLRDKNSVETAIKLTHRKDIRLENDPAKKPLVKLRNEVSIKPTNNKFLTCFLREWTPEYKGELSDKDFELKRNRFESKLASIIKKISLERGLVPVFYPMHTFVVGNDDRDFFRRFTEQYFNGEKYISHSNLSKIEEVAAQMLNSRINLCMRFHSVLFAHSIDATFYAIDYTNGGKIFNYLNDNNLLSRMKSLNEISEEDTNTTYEEIIDEVKLSGVV